MQISKLCFVWNRNPLLAGFGVAMLAFSFAASTSTARPPETRSRKADRAQAATKSIAREKASVDMPEPSGPAPKAEVDKETHDFGSIWAGPNLEAKFNIKNEGEAPLEILRVKPACGCTIAGTYPRVIAPGESGEFPFALNSIKLKGRFAKSIAITTNDPRKREIRLKLEGEAKQHVDVVPTNAVFGKVSAEDEHERVLHIKNNTDKKLQLKLLETDKEPFNFELTEKTPGEEYDLRISMKPPYRSGTQYAKVTLETNIPERPTIPVVASANIPERIDVQPSQIILSATDPLAGQQSNRPVRVTNFGKSPVKVLEAISDDPAIKVEVDERTPGKMYVVNVEIPANHNVPATGRMVTLKTDDERQPLIQIPVVQRAARQAQVIDPNEEQAPRVEQKRQSAEDLIGQPAPALSLTTVEGRDLTAGDFRKHKATVLNFVAANCGFCKKQAPRMEEIRKRYEPQNVRFVNVVQTMRKEYPTSEVVDIFRQAGTHAEIAHDPQNTAGGAYLARGFPTMVIVGESGKVEAVNIGNIADLEDRMKGQLDALVAGKSVPQQLARRTPTPRPSEPAERPKRPSEQMVGQPAPAFSLKTVEGKEVGSNDFARNKATVLNFVAANCGYCKKQAPRIETLREEYEKKGVRFVNVVETMRQKFETDQVVDIFRQAGSKMELAHDPDNQVGGLYNASGFPTMVIVGQSGKIEAVNVGNVGDLESRMKTQLDAVISGKSAPTVAEVKPAARPQPAAQEIAPGKPAPSFSIETVDGKKLASDTLKNNKATVLNFVAPNCGFCKKQAPTVENIRKEYEAKGVRFVNVIQTMRQPYETAQAVDVFKQAGSGAEMAHDPKNEIGTMFQARGFPTMVIVGQSGNVEAVNVGAMADLDARMKAQLDALIEGKPIPAQYAQAPQRRTNRRPAEDLAGKPAPAFNTTTVGGKTLSSNEFASNKATVLNFVAANCGFCKRQVPGVEKVRQEYEAKGVRFVNVVETMRQPFETDQVVDIFKQAGSNLELAHDVKNDVGQLYKVSSFPTLFIVDGKGKVANVSVGAKPNLEEILRTELDKIISGS